MTWRGVPVTGPALIFHDELASLGSDVLNCSHPTLSRVTWHSVDGIPVTDSMANNTGAFQQVRTPAGIFPSEAQLVSNGESSNDSSLNGLWTCQSNNTSAGAFSVGLYNRRGGKITHDYKNRSNPYIGDFFFLVGMCASHLSYLLLCY